MAWYLAFFFLYFLLKGRISVSTDVLDLRRRMNFGEHLTQLPYARQLIFKKSNFIGKTTKYGEANCWIIIFSYFKFFIVMHIHCRKFEKCNNTHTHNQNYPGINLLTFWCIASYVWGRICMVTYILYAQYFFEKKKKRQSERAVGPSGPNVESLSAYFSHLLFVSSTLRPNLTIDCKRGAGFPI